VAAVLICRRCVTYCRPFIELFQATPSTHRASVQNICTHNTLPYCYLASHLPAHALLVICTSCLIVASSASYCKHALSFLFALPGIYQNQLYECIVDH
jgi:hypothetical protein